MTNMRAKSKRLRNGDVKPKTQDVNAEPKNKLPKKTLKRVSPSRKVTKTKSPSKKKQPKSTKAADKTPEPEPEPGSSNKSDSNPGPAEDAAVPDQTSPSDSSVKIEDVFQEVLYIRTNLQKLSDKPRRHKCDTCNKLFLGKNDLRKHTLIHENLKPYACTHCGKKFRQAGNLKNHITSYHSNMIDNPDVYVCDFCKKTFLIKERLRLHIRTHMGIKPYSCKYCRMNFARLGQVKQHIRVHTGERNYHCKHCGASFTCNGKLKMHLKGHYDIREYTCDICGKRFLRPDGMQKHMKCFHNNEKPFKCNICNKMLKGHLQEHLRTHKAAKPHGCSDCGSRFAQRSQLVVHQRTHSGAKPYRCRVCWRAFSYSTALKLHVRRHTGEKPFKCPLCDAAFFQLPHMKKHVSCIHGEQRSYFHRICGARFRKKLELENHMASCEKIQVADDISTEEELSQQIAEAYKPVDPPMTLTKMRLLVAVLLKKISSSKKLEELGFNKRLIDDILTESLELSGHTPSKDETLSPAERLRYNVQLLLDWTVPPNFMEQFRLERRSTEELLEDLTS